MAFPPYGTRRADLLDELRAETRRMAENTFSLPLKKQDVKDVIAYLLGIHINRGLLSKAEYSMVAKAIKMADNLSKPTISEAKFEIKRLSSLLKQTTTLEIGTKDFYDWCYNPSIGCGDAISLLILYQETSSDPSLVDGDDRLVLLSSLNKILGVAKPLYDRTTAQLNTERDLIAVERAQKAAARRAAETEAKDRRDAEICIKTSDRLLRQHHASVNAIREEVYKKNLTLIDLRNAGFRLHRIWREVESCTSEVIRLSHYIEHAQDILNDLKSIIDGINTMDYLLNVRIQSKDFVNSAPSNIALPTPATIFSISSATRVVQEENKQRREEDGGTIPESVLLGHISRMGTKRVYDRLRADSILTKAMMWHYGRDYAIPDWWLIEEDDPEARRWGMRSLAFGHHDTDRVTCIVEWMLADRLVKTVMLVPKETTNSAKKNPTIALFWGHILAILYDVTHKQGRLVLRDAPETEVEATFSVSSGSSLGGTGAVKWAQKVEEPNNAEGEKVKKHFLSSHEHGGHSKDTVRNLRRIGSVYPVRGHTMRIKGMASEAQRELALLDGIDLPERGLTYVGTHLSHVGTEQGIDDVLKRTQHVRLVCLQDSLTSSWAGIFHD